MKANHIARAPRVQRIRAVPKMLQLRVFIPSCIFPVKVQKQSVTTPLPLTALFQIILFKPLGRMLLDFIPNFFPLDYFEMCN